MEFNQHRQPWNKGKLIGQKPPLKPEQCQFASRLSTSPHVSTRQYARIVHQWVAAIGLDSTV